TKLLCVARLRNPLVSFFGSSLAGLSGVNITYSALHATRPISGVFPISRSPAIPHKKINRCFANGFTASISLSIPSAVRSEEHTSELQSRFDLVCRLLLEKKNIGTNPVIDARLTI